MADEVAARLRTDLPDSCSYNVVASFFGVTTMTIRRWIAQDRFPKPVTYGPRTVRWPREVIESWMAEKAAATRAPPVSTDTTPPWKK
ncbi:AlpA family transcriptional regulator [Anaeromyxobacter sp. PSR-1]|uniref:helix-turn-helix transcriptional regulator n=1 Tax=Anaeromyxobacter sp. PSR-1 TaxID=1300915 RepID=UPI0009E55865|nr:AlpA family phage regulatory protein [Anaeromyxobacter sp. PSR-1]